MATTPRCCVCSTKRVCSPIATWQDLWDFPTRSRISMPCSASSRPTVPKPKPSAPPSNPASASPILKHNPTSHSLKKNIFVKFVRFVVNVCHKLAQIFTNYFSIILFGKIGWGIVGIYRIRAILRNGSYPACYILRIILVVDFVAILLNHSASTHVACFVVTFGRVALANTSACCVNELESAIAIVGLGDDAHMANSIATRTTVEEYEVAWLQFAAAHAATIVHLTTRSAV